MIIPCPEDIRSFKRFPLTVTLLLLNLVIFVLIFSGASSGISSAALLKKEGLVLTGRIYFQYLNQRTPENTYPVPTWVQKMKPQDSEQMGVLGAYALRDSRFMEVADKLTYHGDEVQLALWKKNFIEFRQKYQSQILYRFGLSSLEKGPLVWVTYQFSHSTWIHLLSNLAFLVVIGAAVEALAGSGVLLFVYVLGGLFGGLGFLLSDAHGTVPMVGASASISALLAFYCLAESKMRIRFLYLISPMPGNYGAIYLPTLLIIPLFLVVDLASLLATPEGLGSGVAYAAHLGGTVLGVLGGLVYRIWHSAGHSKVSLK